MNFFIVPLVIYPFDIIVSIGETNEQLTKTMKKYGLNYDDPDYDKPTCQARCVMFEGNQTLIRLKRKPKTCEDWGNLQHEIFHAATYVLDAMGMKLELLKSGEAYAYLIQYLTIKIYEKL